MWPCRWHVSTVMNLLDRLGEGGASEPAEIDGGGRADVVVDGALRYC